MNNSSCYRFEQIEYSDGLLDLDATYIIHLEGNGRIENIKSQLNEYHPTNLVYILYNKGYKICDKSADIDQPSRDLIDAFITVFNDAHQKNYKNILILEDDFIFSEKIKKKSTQKKVMEFVNKKSKENENYIYLLGCLPFLQRPYDDNTNILLCGIGTHACIYSRKCIEFVLQQDQTRFNDWDYYTQMNITKYMYHEPLCYQLFPETENQKNWMSFFGLKDVLVLLIRLCKLDVKEEPGYTIFYNISKVLPVLIILLLIFLLVAIPLLIYNIIRSSGKTKK
jgi:hypothetical protein